jgi:hypothetical protein
MKTAVKTTSEDRKKIIAVAAFLVVAAAVLYFELRTPDVPAAPAPAVVATAPAGSSGNLVAAAPVTTGGPAAKVVGTTSGGLDPTLHMDAMLVSESVVYSGSGRNIFSTNSAPLVVIPKPVATARVIPAVVVPCPPNCPPPPRPPPPPPIPLKFFGTEASASGVMQAFLLHDDTVYTASAGDVVLRRYRVIAIDAKTIQLEDMPNNNKQTLPLLSNP